jgi:hypothetical protein
MIDLLDRRVSNLTKGFSVLAEMPLSRASPARTVTDFLDGHPLDPAGIN